MQADHSKPEMDFSSFSLKRRGFLTGTAAAAVAIGAPVAAEATADNYDELMFLLDARDELERQHVAAVRALDEIDMRADRPPSRSVIDLVEMLGEAHTDRYYRTCRQLKFVCDGDAEALRSFFRARHELAQNRAKCRPDEWGEWPAVVSRDYRKALSELRWQTRSRQHWESASGYASAEAELNRSLDALVLVEHAILGLPVLSLRDLRLKLDIVERGRWTMDADDMRAILQSMRDFANSRPSAASGLLVPGAS